MFDCLVLLLYSSYTTLYRLTVPPIETLPRNWKLDVKKTIVIGFVFKNKHRIPIEFLCHLQYRLATIEFCKVSFVIVFVKPYKLLIVESLSFGRHDEQTFVDYAQN